MAKLTLQCGGERIIFTVVYGPIRLWEKHHEPCLLLCKKNQFQVDYASECERLNIKILEENMEESLQNPEVGKGSLNGTHTALIMKEVI